jgi:hypothetical protein
MSRKMRAERRAGSRRRWPCARRERSRRLEARGSDREDVRVRVELGERGATRASAVSGAKPKFFVWIKGREAVGRE